MILAAFVIATAFLTAPGVPQTSEDGAVRYVRELGAQLIDALSPSRTPADRDARVQKLLSEHLHVPLLGRYVMGTAWRQSTPSQRAQYEQLFRPWVLHRYSRQLENHRGRSLEVTGTRPAGQHDMLIETRIVGQTFAPIQASWRIRAVGTGYKVVDVMIDGASLALSQRLEFAGVVQREGIDGLIARMRAQVARFQSGRG